MFNAILAQAAAPADNGTQSDIAAQACNIIGQEFSRGQQFLEQIWAWACDKGVETLVNVLAAILILIVGGFVVKGISAVARRALKKTRSVNPLLENFLCSVVTKTGWIFLIVIALGKIGVDVGPLVAGLGVTGFVLGFAFKDTLANFASGVMIALNQPFKVGDYVIVAGSEGTVIELHMMATVIATADNKKIVVPNNSVWGGPVTNFSAMAKRRVDLAIGVAYGTDIAKAKAAALEALKAIPQVLADPAAMAEVVTFDDSEITLTVRAWCKNADYWTTFFAGNQALDAAFAKAGIEIPFPQIDVHMKNV